MDGIKKCLFRKKGLYTICFILLGMIDFVRHTQQEIWWGPLVNLTGILLLLIVLSQYKWEELRCWFSYIWSGISIMLLVFSAVRVGDHIFGIYKWTFFTAVLNVWMIGILTFRIAKKILIERSIQIKWNIKGVLAVLMVFFMMRSPYDAVWPMWFLAVFGIFYLTKFEEKNFIDLQEAVINGIIIVFLILQIYAYGYRPFDVNRYVGAFSNSNMTALHYLVTYVAVLIKLHFVAINKSGRKWKVILLIGAAVLIDFQILTMTRTAWLISAVITILFGIVVMKNLWEKSWRSVLKSGCLLIFSAMILFPVVFTTVRWLPALRHHPVWYEGEWTEEKIHSFDPADSDKYTDFNEFMGNVLERLKIVDIANDLFVLKVKAAETEEYRSLTLNRPEDSASSFKIRLAIYKAYLEDLNWTGHKKMEGHYIIPEINVFVWHPQNVWIQMAYYYGALAGALFLILTVLILKNQISGIIKNEENVSTLISLFMSIIFLMYGLTELVWTIGQLILFLFLFVQHPQFKNSSWNN